MALNKEWQAGPQVLGRQATELSHYGWWLGRGGKTSYLVQCMPFSWICTQCLDQGAYEGMIDDDEAVMQTEI